MHSRSHHLSRKRNTLHIAREHSLGINSLLDPNQFSPVISIQSLTPFRLRQSRVSVVGETSQLSHLLQALLKRRHQALEVGDSISRENIVYSGPLYQSSKIDGNKITISFADVGSGLITNDGEELNYFSIAGADKKFVWAKAKIEGDKVVVWNDAITQPMYVRYAWADNPFGANLYNKEGLPASPFRTDE